MDIAVPVRWVLFSILLLVWFYIACRLGAAGVAKSWFDERKKRITKGDSDGNKEK